MQVMILTHFALLNGTFMIFKHKCNCKKLMLGCKLSISRSHDFVTTAWLRTVLNTLYYKLILRQVVKLELE